ncbi:MULTISPECIES: hypothetical protein [unclassified Leptolyngbya]|uniref:hypothetical protein n=1 Tax=unclassified Leptolyngbya TaxID=2650499 RepID=UPI001687762B|nr:MULTISPECIES: hypothetical protein [unclassified Leptolyngbya]MBD1913929.1 hypothetical protein [Leptolyngbya sp. FACHB-8]MBD2156578.1 hypothetical protein [Leptolyngbya sp. FACHB-16]
MPRSQHRGIIRPKISTMPRQKSEAAAFLDIYKLVVEKKRLQQELESLDQRRQQICDRITVLDRHVAHMENSVDQMRAAEGNPVQPPPVVLPPDHVDTFDMLFLDY